MSIFLENESNIKHRTYNEDVLTINTAYKLLRDGTIRSFRLGNSYKILRKSVEEYIYSH